MKTVAIIQARMSSSRLPGKVLRPLCGMPLIVFMHERVRLARRVDEIVIATSSDESDDPLAQVLDKHGVRCFRGDLDDVLGRVHAAALCLHADRVVRLTGDCPLIDADVIDAVVGGLTEGIDYASNVAPPTYPDGLDVEACTFEALDQAFAQGTLRSDREHVTPYVRRTAQVNKRQVNIASAVDMSHLRWTVDYEDDLQFVSALLASTSTPDPKQCDRFDLLRALDANPHLASINRHTRNEGLQKSLLADTAAP